MLGTPMSGEYTFEPYVATYYLSGQTTPVCAFSRRLRLNDHPHLWKRQLIQAWLGMVDTMAPVDLFVVQPLPFQNDANPPIFAFVLIVQHLDPQSRPTLLTIAEQQEYIHIAAILPQDVAKRQVVERAGLRNRCYGGHADSWCFARYGYTPIEEAQPVPLLHGAGIHIDLFSLDCQFESLEDQYALRLHQGDPTAAHASSGLHAVPLPPGVVQSSGSSSAPANLPPSGHESESRAPQIQDGHFWDLPRSRPCISLESALPPRETMPSCTRSVPMRGIEQLSTRLLED